MLAPTRELAAQVGKSFTTYGKYVRFSQTLVYGGVGQVPQVNAMRRGVDVLVATPGRLLDLIDQRHIDLSQVEFFVLDEVDRMLDMGFLRDVKRIVSLLPAKRQSLFFSATLAPNIVELARTILRDPAHVSITPETTTAEKIDQQVCFLDARQQASAVGATAARPVQRGGSEADHRLQPHQTRREQTRQEPVRRRVSRRMRSTATSRRPSAKRRSTVSSKASHPCSSPPMSPPAAWM